jgi:tRNA pseudouridine38-40 synthase
VGLHKVAALVEYDGTLFSGYQLQVGVRTVQGELEAAVQRLSGAVSRVQAASRTDTGVHAAGQVVSVWVREDMEPSTLVSGMNHYLPSDVAVKGACVIDGDFDVRRRAVVREYRYSIVTGATRRPTEERFALRVRERLDANLMRAAARLMQGVHDLGSFATALEEDVSTVRLVHEARILEERGRLEVVLAANAFLRHQVRNTVGQLIRVGLGKCSVEEFAGLMREARPGAAGPAAPARGLCLMRVGYEAALPFAA